MANVTAEMVKKLRQETGAGVLDCREALALHDGDFEKAAAYLHEKGRAAADKRSERQAKEGLIGSYIHAGSKVAAMVEINCETDFVARTPDFQDLAHDLAMQVVAARPLYVSTADVPADVVEQRRAEFRAEAVESGKDEAMLDRIVEGKMSKFFEENCLMLQPFIKNSALTVGDLVKQKNAVLGENLIVRRFARLEVGEP